MDFGTPAIELCKAAVNYFDLIQLARDFEQDFAAHQLRLDILQIRLSRWGEAAGINHGTAPAPSRKDESSDTRRKQAEQLLSAIQDTLSKAQTDAGKMKPELDDCKEEPLDPEACLPHHVKNLRRKLHETIQKRKSRVKMAIDSMKWAFYKKEHFGEFVKRISILVDDLEGLFPEQTREKLQDLSKEECQGISNPNLEEFQEIVEECDPWMKKAVEELLRPKGSESGVNITQSHTTGMTTGYHHGHVYGQSNGSGSTNTLTWANLDNFVFSHVDISIASR